MYKNIRKETQNHAITHISSLFVDLKALDKQRKKLLYFERYFKNVI